MRAYPYIISNYCSIFTFHLNNKKQEKDKVKLFKYDWLP